MAALTCSACRLHWPMEEPYRVICVRCRGPVKGTGAAPMSQKLARGLLVEWQAERYFDDIDLGRILRGEPLPEDTAHDRSVDELIDAAKSARSNGTQEVST
jgi:hypothetical protein